MSKAEIANVDRKQTKVATELETLARNYAVGMGGNTIVAQELMTDDGSRRLLYITARNSGNQILIRDSKTWSIWLKKF